jgi:hypothetical protein
MHYHQYYPPLNNPSIVLHLIICTNKKQFFSKNLSFLFTRSLTTASTSLITITTHEFLLHTLISGDYLLKSSITHLIIDDVHKRSHTLDMLLAYLKDAQHKFRHLKIIFIQTTIHYDTLVKYFGNVATYTSISNKILIVFRNEIYRCLVEMKTEEIEELFLDQILIDIQRIDQNKCLSIGKNYFVIFL